MPPPVIVSVPARAGLAGGPSDLYGGAVLAVPVRSFAATVELGDSTDHRIVGDDDGLPLVAAARGRVPDATPCEVRWTTNIPRGVGLAGSSAIVVATLRALHLRAGRHVDDLDLALLALSVEADDLGIVAGLQDRAVQAAGAALLVDVSGPRPVITSLEPRRSIELIVAWLDAAAGHSGDYHSRLRAKLGIAPDNAAMADLAALAREGADAFAAGDTDRLAECMAASATIRDRVAPLGAEHQRLAVAVAAVGLRPNTTGSGGAVAAVVDDRATAIRAQDAVRAIGGGCVIESYGV